ncbi:putative transmembrane protein [Toxoplasma gondii FOU]|uniref:Putative transmembrane protein n=3 Tax=Toxoplasma gondii TaxID=5811 RepID=A0A086LAX3_TOXGO|nr:putative transmembrane protein [Toxoplasma gondii FOU]PUA91392.1 putative transmembrane protein [Toxoplasma gondii TgCATBr9]RQX68265.1 putative transmembrane protein [Toxoplasma gondii CAST]
MRYTVIRRVVAGERNRTSPSHGRIFIRALVCTALRPLLETSVLTQDPSLFQFVGVRRVCLCLPLPPVCVLPLCVLRQRAHIFIIFSRCEQTRFSCAIVPIMTNWRGRRAPERQRAFAMLYLLTPYLLFCSVAVPSCSASCSLSCVKKAQTDRTEIDTSLSSTSTGNSHALPPASDPLVPASFLSLTEEGAAVVREQEVLPKDETRETDAETKGEAGEKSQNSACDLSGAGVPPCCSNSSCRNGPELSSTTQSHQNLLTATPLHSSERPSEALPTSHRSLEAVDSSYVPRKRQGEITQSANNDAAEKSGGQAEVVVSSHSHFSKQTSGDFEKGDKPQTVEDARKHLPPSGEEIEDASSLKTAPSPATNVTQQSNVESAAHEIQSGKQGSRQQSAAALAEKADTASTVDEKADKPADDGPKEELRSSEKRFMQVTSPSAKDKKSPVLAESGTKTEGGSMAGNEAFQTPQAENDPPASSYPSSGGGFSMPLWVLMVSIVGVIAVAVVGLLVMFLFLRNHRTRQRKKQEAKLMLRRMIRSNSIPTPELVSRYAREMRAEDDFGSGESGCSQSQTGDGTAPLPPSDGVPGTPKKRCRGSKAYFIKVVKLPFRSRREVSSAEQAASPGETLERSLSTSSSLSHTKPAASVPDESLPSVSDPRTVSSGGLPSGWKKVENTLGFFASFSSRDGIADIPLSPAGMFDVPEVRHEFASTPSPQEAKRGRNKWVVVARHQHLLHAPAQSLSTLRSDRDDACCDRPTWTSDVSDDPGSGGAGGLDPSQGWSSDIPSHMMQTAIHRETEVIDEDAIVEFDATVPLENTDEGDGEVETDSRQGVATQT